MAVGTSSFSLNQEVELSRNTVAATAAKFEDCDRAVNAANDESRSLASKFRRLEGISTQLFEILKGKAAELDRLKGILLRLSGDPNQQSQGQAPLQKPEPRGMLTLLSLKASIRLGTLGLLMLRRGLLI